MNRTKWIQTLLGILIDIAAGFSRRRSRSTSGDLQTPPPLDLGYEDKLINDGLSGPVVYSERADPQPQLPGMVLSEVPDIAVPEPPSDVTSTRSSATSMTSNIEVVEGVWNDPEKHFGVPRTCRRHGFAQGIKPLAGLFQRPYEGLEWHCVHCQNSGEPLHSDKSLKGPYLVVTVKQPPL